MKMVVIAVMVIVTVIAVAVAAVVILKAGQHVDTRLWQMPSSHFEPRIAPNSPVDVAMPGSSDLAAAAAGSVRTERTFG